MPSPRYSAASQYQATLRRTLQQPFPSTARHGRNARSRAGVGCFRYSDPTNMKTEQNESTLQRLKSNVCLKLTFHKAGIMSLTTKREETRQKLIEAAGRTFAEVGYEAATVREITERANTNIASVNYHFRDKQQLYGEVFGEVIQKRRPLLEARCAHGSPKQRLRAFIEWAMLVDKAEDREWYHVLIAREMSDGSGTKTLEFVVNMIRPIHELLISILDDMTNHELSRMDLEIVSHLVAWSCTEWLHRMGFVRKLSPEITFTRSQLEHRADLIYSFVLGGLNHVVRDTHAAAILKS